MAVQQHVLNWLYSVLTSEYQDVNRTYNDVAQALSQFPSLSPRTDVHTFPNGASALLLHLSGTLPAVFRGATYRYPISLWVPHAYPREAPLVYVTPTENMVVRPGQHVDPQGQVYHPYLVGWSEFWDKSTMVDFLAILRDIFAKEPPVISRQAVRPPLPPPSASAAPTPPPVPPLPQELASHPRPHTVSPPPTTVAQPPAPPPKGNAQPPPPPPPIAAATSSHSTPSPPPIPPHPRAAHRQSISSVMQEPGGPRYASPPSLPAQQAASAVSGAPPIPGRPRYQQSPLSQPPISQSIQQTAPPQPPQQQYPPYHAQQQAVPPPSQSGSYAQQYSYAQPPTFSQQQQIPPSQWQQQQQQQLQQQQQQLQPSRATPHQQHLPPPPDLMDAPVTAPTPSGESSASPPPPVPPNPEKDALLHQLAQTLAAQRQHSRAQNEASLAGLQGQRAAMLAAAGRLQQDMSSLAQLSALLTANTAMLHEALAAADDVVARSRQRQPPGVDELLVGPSVVANQLYDLVAEERALADAVFMLGRAVERGRVSPAVFAKMTRSLAREWYLKKALVRKIGRGMGLAAV